VALILLMVGWVILAVLYVDQGISYSYLSSDYSLLKRNNANVLRILAGEWKGLARDDVLRRVNRHFEGRLVYRPTVSLEDTKIYVDEVAFIFVGGRLDRIEP
jgi:hypothetical protein